MLSHVYLLDVVAACGCIFLMVILYFFFLCKVDLRDLHSFPTRRSSDLFGSPAYAASRINRLRNRNASSPARMRFGRSEEHTSELQSLTNLVCRLLLEKKKRNN